MAAENTFQSFNSLLSDRERAIFKQLIQQTTEELLAARSEDARIRIVNSYLEEIHDRVEGQR